MTKERVIDAGKHYGWGLIAASWNGGWSAVAGIFGIDAVALTGADGAVAGGTTQVHVLNFHEMISAFLGACALHAILWIKANPLPSTLDTDPPFPVRPPNP